MTTTLTRPDAATDTEADGDAPAVNVDLLRKVVTWVKQQAARPDGGAWRQDDWVTNTEDLAAFDGCTCTGCVTSRAQIEACGTAYCVAGYIGHLDGVLKLRTITIDGREVHLETGFTTSGEHVSVHAARRLNLPVTFDPDGEAVHRLFDGENTAADIRRIAEELAGGAL